MYIGKRCRSTKWLVAFDQDQACHIAFALDSQVRGSCQHSSSSRIEMIGGIVAKSGADLRLPVGWRVRGRDIFPYFTKISENILNREIFVWGRGVFFYTICLLIPGRILFRSYKNMCLLILYKAICQVLTSC